MTDSMRLLLERLLQKVAAHIQSETGFLHARSSWHVEVAEPLIPLAENMALSLLWCRSKKGELILAARNLLERLFKYRRGLFPSYLHEVEQTTSVHASWRAAFALGALVKWHQAALGDLYPKACKELKELLEALALTKMKESKEIYENIYSSCDLYSFFKHHIFDEKLPNHLKWRLENSMTTWHEPLWLETPLDVQKQELSLFELLQILESKEIDLKPSLSLLWAALYHEEGTKLLNNYNETSPKLDLIAYSFRSLEQPAIKRPFAKSCCFIFQDSSQNRLSIYSKVAKIEILQQDTASYMLNLHYDPALTQSSLESQELFALFTECRSLKKDQTLSCQNPPWMALDRDGSYKAFNSISLKQMGECGAIFTPLEAHLTLETEVAKGYLHQGPCFNGDIEIQPLSSFKAFTRFFSYTPLELSEKISLKLLLKWKLPESSCENPFC